MAVFKCDIELIKVQNSLNKIFKNGDDEDKTHSLAWLLGFTQGLITAMNED